MLNGKASYGALVWMPCIGKSGIANRVEPQSKQTEISGNAKTTDSRGVPVQMEMDHDLSSKFMGDYEFSKHPEDLELLEKISQVAASAHAPFLSAASSEC